MLLVPVPAFTDNYIWLLAQGGKAWVVDPGEAEPILKSLKTEKLELAGILVTHHHGDHTGGIKALLEHTNVPVYGPHDSPCSDLISHRLYEGEQIQLGNLLFSVISVPGHTLDHIAFYCQTANILFCGDTLFSGGCGRVFEGTYEQMYDSLCKLMELPEETKICCAHEYTLSNLQFANSTEPDNRDIENYQNRCKTLRQQNLPTLPSTIAQEKKINPFFRCLNLDEFSRKRELKNNF